MFAKVDARQWSQRVLSEMSCCVYRVMRGGELSGFHMSRAAANNCAAVPRVAAMSLSRAMCVPVKVSGDFFFELNLCQSALIWVSCDLVQSMLH